MSQIPRHVKSTKADFQIRQDHLYFALPKIMSAEASTSKASKKSKKSREREEDEDVENGEAGVEVNKNKRHRKEKRESGHVCRRHELT